MKVLSCNFNQDGLKQIVLSVTTMHVINTASHGRAFKKLPIPISKNWKHLEEKDYSIEYPVNWRLDKPKTEQGFVLFPESAYPSGDSRENINLLVQNLTGQNMNLHKFVEHSEKQIREVISHVEIKESETLYFDNNEFHKIQYSGVIQSKKYEFLQYYWVKKEKAYILTLTCKEQDFEKERRTAEKIMDSFRLADADRA